MNLEQAKRNFESDLENKQYAIDFLRSIHRTVDFDNISNYDKTLVLKANIVMENIQELYAIYAAALGHPHATLLYPKITGNAKKILAKEYKAKNKIFLISFAYFCAKTVLPIFEKSNAPEFDFVYDGQTRIFNSNQVRLYLDSIESLLEEKEKNFALWPRLIIPEDLTELFPTNEQFILRDDSRMALISIDLLNDVIYSKRPGPSIGSAIKAAKYAEAALNLSEDEFSEIHDFAASYEPENLMLEFLSSITEGLL